VTNRLRVLLDERRVSQSELAYLTNLPYTTVRRLVRQGCNPSLDHVLRLSAVLGAPVEEMFVLDRELDGRCTGRRRRPQASAA